MAERQEIEIKVIKSNKLIIKSTCWKTNCIFLFGFHQASPLLLSIPERGIMFSPDSFKVIEKY